MQRTHVSNPWAGVPPLGTLDECARTYPHRRGGGIQPMNTYDPYYAAAQLGLAQYAYGYSPPTIAEIHAHILRMNLATDENANSVDKQGGDGKDGQGQGQQGQGGAGHDSRLPNNGPGLLPTPVPMANPAAGVGIVPVVPQVVIFLLKYSDWLQGLNVNK